MDERDKGADQDNADQGTIPQAGIPAEEIGRTTYRREQIERTYGNKEELGNRTMTRAEVNSEAIDGIVAVLTPLKVAVDDLDRGLDAVRDLTARLAERVHADFDRVRVRLDDLEVAQPGRVTLSGRVNDLETCVGMRNDAIAKLERELAAVRATRDRAIGESSRRGTRIEELEERIEESRPVGRVKVSRDALVERIAELNAFLASRDRTISEFGERIEAVREARNAAIDDREDTESGLERLKVDRDVTISKLETENLGLERAKEKLEVDLRETVRRKDSQIAGFVGEIRDLREKLEGISKTDTFVHSAAEIVSMVVQEVRADAGALGGVPPDRVPGLVEKIDDAFRAAARLPTNATYAVVFETETERTIDGDVGVGINSELVLEDELDLRTASARFDELAKVVPEVVLAAVVRRFRRVV